MNSDSASSSSYGPSEFPLPAALDATLDLTPEVPASCNGPSELGSDGAVAEPGSACLGRFVMSDAGPQQMDTNADIGVRTSNDEASGFPLRAALEATRDLTPADLAPTDGSAELGSGIDDPEPGGYRLGRFEVSDAGVHRLDTNSDGTETQTWICSRLDIVARTRTKEGEGWGALLQWFDADKRRHEWAMPFALLAGDGQEIRRMLLDSGLRLASGQKARASLMEFLNHSPEKTAWSASRTGWHGRCYVLPNQSFGNEGQSVVYQPLEVADHAFRVAGTLEDWRTNVGSYCVGNSRLAFGVSLAFAGPLLSLIGEEGGGFHFRGATSSGKTTALEAAGSVWGGGDRPSYIHRWRATANGIEAICELHNDGLLVLDELSQVDPREAGDVAYMIANGAGKARANRSGGARAKKSWRLVYLSAGEIGLRDHMAAAGKRTRAGQDIRMADIPMDAGAGLGGFEKLYGMETPDAFARNIKSAAGRYYGTPIRAFLLHLVERDPAEAVKFVTSFRQEFIDDQVPAGASGEVFRLASRFALVAAAGEVAAAAGILPWPKGEATLSAIACFQAWLVARGNHGSGDVETAIDQVREFIESHGSSRFEPLGADRDAHRVVTYDRAGFRRQDPTSGATEYLVLGEVFKHQVCAGYDPTTTAKAMVARGYLIAAPDGKLTTQVSVASGTRVRVYRVQDSVLGG